MLASRLGFPRAAVNQKNVLKTIVIVVKKASALTIDVDQILALFVPIDNLVRQTSLASDICEDWHVSGVINCPRRRIGLPPRAAYHGDGEQNSETVFETHEETR